MAGFLTTNDITFFTGAFQTHFDTFSAHRYIVVHKESVATPVDYTTSPYYGYGDTSTPNNFTYTFVTGRFSAMIRDSFLVPEEDKLEDINIEIGKNKVEIKVLEAAKNFIENGKTERIELDDGRVFNTYNTFSVQNYLGMRHYVYLLEKTQ